MNREPASDDDCSAWNPGVGTELPAAFRPLESICRSECVFTGPEEIRELASLTGLPAEELTAFRPARLALHELIVRITADIAVSEGDTEEVFGRNFRRIARRIHDADLAPRMESIERAYDELRRQADDLVRAILSRTLYASEAAPARKGFGLGLLRRARQPAARCESPSEREYRIICGFREAGRRAEDPLEQAAFRSLYRVLGAIAGKRGSLVADQELLVRLVTRHVCNSHGSTLIGRHIAPLIDAAIEREAYTRVAEREAPILVSLKGASAAGKSSLRPKLKQLMLDNGIAPDGYATISPDVWRRLLIDYESLGPARKYAGQLTSRELMVIDAKLDRYIRDKASRARAIPHLLVDRFRFDSFSSEKIARVLHDTYARYVSTMYMYFIVTPPEETVERGWQRALAIGRYKAVEDLLAHCVEAYVGMPKLLFKWLANQRLDYRYHFLDNRVPKGSFPRTIAWGNQHEMTICDPARLIDIERYQKININARTPEQVYPPAPLLEVARNCGFLKECIRRIGLVSFVDGAGGAAYLRARNGSFEVLDAATLARVLSDGETAQVIREIAPEFARG